MTRRQRIFFRIGAWAAVGTAFIHIAGQFAGLPAPANETESLLLKLMTEYEKDMGGGIRRSTADFLTGFSVSFSILLAWAGTLALLVERRSGADAGFMRSVAWLCAVFATGMLVVSVVQFIWPPTVCLAIVLLGFAGSLPGGSRTGS